MNPHDPKTPDDPANEPDTPIDPRLEDAMRALTEWPDDESPRVWERALRAHGERPRPTVLARLGTRRVAGAVAAVLLLGVVGTVMLRSGASEQHFTHTVGSSAMSPSGLREYHRDAISNDVTMTERDGATILRRADSLRDEAWDSPTASTSGRLVATRVTMELRVEDVRIAFTKLTAMCSEVRGEHVQSSALTGDGPGATATATLRIDSTRLSDFLNDARLLGDVVSEQSTGEDVTDHVVDLGARLRNEQRVETELLELLDSRQDAPLDELLELREQLNRVRTTIERMTAARDTLSRQVKLSRVTVIMRAVDGAAASEPERQGLGAYIGDAFGGAWHQGLRALIDSVAWIAHVLVAGLLWWVACGVLVLLVIRGLRSQSDVPESTA